MHFHSLKKKTRRLQSRDNKVHHVAYTLLIDQVYVYVHVHVRRETEARMAGAERRTEAEASVLPCKEFSEFKVSFKLGVSIDPLPGLVVGVWLALHYNWILQDALQQQRALDDRIVYRLNASVPTESFTGQVSAREQCMDLYVQVQQLFVC